MSKMMYLAAESAPFKELSWKPHNFFLTSNWLFVSTGEAGKCSWGTLVSPHNTEILLEKKKRMDMEWTNRIKGIIKITLIWASYHSKFAFKLFAWITK